MAMFRRSPKSSPPLRRRQEEITRQEAELRERLEKLERLVAKVPLIEKNRSDHGPKDNRADKRFRVSVAAQAGGSAGESRKSRRPRSLRKERRRPNHFPPSCGGACRRSHLAGQQPAFVSNNHGRDFEARRWVRRQAGANQSHRRGSKRVSETAG